MISAAASAASPPPRGLEMNLINGWMTCFCSLAYYHSLHAAALPRLARLGKSSFFCSLARSASQLPPSGAVEAGRRTKPQAVSVSSVSVSASTSDPSAAAHLARPQKEARPLVLSVRPSTIHGCRIPAIQSLPSLPIHDMCTTDGGPASLGTI